ncbi:MAG: preprotein translocase subunit SecE [Pseudobacteriovorax sp.]|nr:preprotein translocase subunit SecE [Pseudobacteriovorax sp.]
MKKDDVFYLKLAYLIFAGVVAYTLSKAFVTLGVQTGWSERYADLFTPVSGLASLVLGGLATFWLARDAERHEYFLASIAEIRKVTWPSFPDTKRMTIVVCVVVAIFSLILAAFDLVWGQVLGIMLA